MSGGGGGGGGGSRPSPGRVEAPRRVQSGVAAAPQSSAGAARGWDTVARGWDTGGCSPPTPGVSRGDTGGGAGDLPSPPPGSPPRPSAARSPRGCAPPAVLGAGGTTAPGVPRRRGGPCPGARRERSRAGGERDGESPGPAEPNRTGPGRAGLGRAGRSSGECGPKAAALLRCPPSVGTGTGAAGPGGRPRPLPGSRRRPGRRERGKVAGAGPSRKKNTLHTPPPPKKGKKAAAEVEAESCRAQGGPRGEGGAPRGRGGPTGEGGRSSPSPGRRSLRGGTRGAAPRAPQGTPKAQPSPGVKTFPLNSAEKATGGRAHLLPLPPGTAPAAPRPRVCPCGGPPALRHPAFCSAAAPRRSPGSSTRSGPSRLPEEEPGSSGAQSVQVWVTPGRTGTQSSAGWV